MLYDFKFRTENFRMFFHVLVHTYNAAEKAHMTKLVNLVVSNGLHRHMFPEIIQVSLRSSYRRNTGTREADFGCGNKFVNHIRISCFFTFIQKFQKEVLFVVI